MNVDCALFLTCLFFLLCVCMVFYPTNKAGCANLWWYLRVVGCIDWRGGCSWLGLKSTCCSAVFGTPRQTATATPHPPGGPLLRPTSSQSGTPNLPPMSNAAGVASHRPSQRSRGLWYVATGNARQMAAWDCIERFQVMASYIIVGARDEQQLMRIITPVLWFRGQNLKSVCFCEVLVPAIGWQGAS